jgi:hypothetical protein
MSLFSRHSVAVQTIYSDLKRRALEQLFVLVGTPGSVGEREVRGRPFLYRQFYDARGKKVADYLGSSDDDGARRRAAEVRDAIEVANGLLGDARLLAREGYVRVESRTNAVIASLANHGMFRAGALLVGSHAFGALLNDMGVKGGAHLTEDVDVARLHRLELEDGHASFAKMLDDSTLPLSPVLGSDRRVPPTSFKIAGRDRLRVDLLTPAPGRDVKVVAVPELDAHATALPHLAYLLGESIEAVVIGRESVVPVRVPRPERFAIHKLWVAQVRDATSDKRPKDIRQAALLIAALAEDDATAVEEAVDIFPKIARSKMRLGAQQARDVLSREDHERGAALLRSIGG